MDHVWVVTSTELGWDNVVGVFDASIDQEDIQDKFKSTDGYHVWMHEVWTKLSAVDD